MKKTIFLVVMAALLLAQPARAAVTLDGTDDIASCGSAAGIDNLTLRTYCVRFTLNSLNTSELYSLMTKANAGNGAAFYVEENGGLGAVVGLYFQGTIASGWFVGSAYGLITSGTTHSACMTIDIGSIANHATLYLDGAALSNDVQDQLPVGAYEDDSASNLEFGAHTGDGEYANITIQESFMTNTILTAAQISNWHNAKIRNWPKDVLGSAVLGYWRFDDQPTGDAGDGDTARDTSGNDNNCTLSDGANNTGMTWASEKTINLPPDGDLL